MISWLCQNCVELIEPGGEVWPLDLGQRVILFLDSDQVLDFGVLEIVDLILWMSMEWRNIIMWIINTKAKRTAFLVFALEFDPG